MRSRVCRRLQDDGAAAVEFALILPLFVMLTVGTISAGFAFHTWLSVTHGAQESSRFAATLSVDAAGGTTDDWLNEVAERAAAASDISMAAGEAEPDTTICVAVVSPANIPALNSHLTLTADSGGTLTAGAPATGPCPQGSSMTGDYVQTYVSRPVSFNYVLGSARINVASKSVNRFEAVSLS
jgi:Flp pilus assembly protein TadG